MPTEQINILKRFAYEGPLSVGAALAIGLVVVAVIAVALWREAKLSGSRWVGLFWVLRSAAVAVLLWMLVGPADQTIHQRNTPKSIAIVADNSQSMQVVDPPQRYDDVRWMVAGHAADSGESLAACDQLAVAATYAGDELQQVLEQLEQGRPIDALRRRLNTVRSAAATALDRAKHAVSQLDTGGGGLATRFGRLINTLENSILPHLQFASEGVGGRLAFVDERRLAELHSLVPQLADIAGQARQLSKALIQQQQTYSDNTTSSRLRRDTVLSRRDKVARALDAAERHWLNQLAKTVRVHRISFEAAASARSSADWQQNLDSGTSADSSSTNLSAVFEQISRDAAVEMFEQVVLVSDGRHNESQARNPRDVAAALGNLPVHVVPIGSSEMLRDLILHHVETPTAVDENDLIVVEAILTAYDCAGETCVVELIHDDETVDREQIEVGSVRSDHRIRLSTRAPAVGRYSYELRVQPVPDEHVNDNNRATFGVDVVDDELNILLADNVPRWEFRYLANLFHRDERIQFDQLLFGPERTATGELRSTASFPKDVEGWSRYRVAILGDISPSQLDSSSQQALREYVATRGRTLILIAGRENMPQRFANEPLGHLLPVQPSDDFADPRRGYSLELTSEGRQASAMQIADEAYGSDRVWREMSRALPLYSLSAYSRPKPASHTLIRAIPAGGRSGVDREQAFLCWHNVGRGRVVYLSAPASYQLRVRHGDRYHHRFWGQLLRWSVAGELAAGSQTVRVSTDKSRYEFDESIQVIAQLSEADGQPVADAAPQVEAWRDDEIAATLPLEPDENIPGRYLGRIDELPPGPHQIRVVGRDVDRLLGSENVSGPIETEVVVEPPTSTEMADTRSNRPLLTQIAEVTGGQVVPPTALAEIVQLADLSPHVTEEISHRPLWNRWIYLTIIVVCLTSEWSLRKLIGLA